MPYICYTLGMYSILTNCMSTEIVNSDITYICILLYIILLINYNLQLFLNMSTLKHNSVCFLICLHIKVMRIGSHPSPLSSA